MFQLVWLWCNHFMHDRSHEACHSPHSGWHADHSGQRVSIILWIWENKTSTRPQYFYMRTSTFDSDPQILGCRWFGHSYSAWLPWRAHRWICRWILPPSGRLGWISSCTLRISGPWLTWGQPQMCRQSRHSVYRRFYNRSVGVFIKDAS